MTVCVGISCSWIDIWHYCYVDGVYWNRRTFRYTEEEWRTLLRHLPQDLGIEVLFLQNVTKDGWSVYPSQVVPRGLPFPPGASRDPVGVILRAAGGQARVDGAKPRVSGGVAPDVHAGDPLQGGGANSKEREAMIGTTASPQSACARPCGRASGRAPAAPRPARLSCDKNPADARSAAAQAELGETHYESR